MSLTAKYGNWVAEITATTGTGNITLSGALSSQYTTFSAVVSEGEQIYYHIFDRGTNNQEAGIASVLAGGALLRIPQATLIGGVYDNTSPTAISLSGNAIVYGSATANTISLLSSEVQARLPKDGSEPMTGQLILSGDATNDLGAVPKQQLDAAIISQPNENLLDNSDFMINERVAYGSYSNSLVNYFTDRWAVAPSGGSATVSRVKFGTGYTGPHQYAVLLNVATSSDYCELSQTIENAVGILGGKVTFSCYYRSTRDLTVRVYLVDDIGDIYAPVGHTATLPNTGGSLYQQYSVTLDVPLRKDTWNVDNGVHLVLRIGTYDDTTSTAWDMTMFNPKLEVGPYATPYVNKHPSIERDNCLRYYYKIQPSGYANRRLPHGFVNATGAIITTYIPFKVPMRVEPTFSLASHFQFNILIETVTQASTNIVPFVLTPEDVSLNVTLTTTTSPNVIGNIYFNATSGQYIAFDAEF